jgi:thymidylate kinase
MEMLTNKIITLSGCDRVGKGTQAKLLAAAMNAKLFRFPDYNTITGQLIKACLTNGEVSLRPVDGKGELSAYREIWKKEAHKLQLLHVIDKLDHQEAIEEALKTQDCVMDRYDVDALVYGYVDGCGLDWTDNLLFPIRRSDLVIVLSGASYDRDEEPDVNERNSSYMERVDKAYTEDHCELGEMYNISQVRVPYYGETYSQKLLSIRDTHIIICSEVSKYFWERNEPRNILPLNGKEIEEIVGGSVR